MQNSLKVFFKVSEYQAQRVIRAPVPGRRICFIQQEFQEARKLSDLSARVRPRKGHQGTAMLVRQGALYGANIKVAFHI
jgi:hypothetical protein